MGPDSWEGTDRCVPVGTDGREDGLWTGGAALPGASGL
jgi:hypothetical protein